MKEIKLKSFIEKKFDNMCKKQIYLSGFCFIFFIINIAMLVFGYTLWERLEKVDKSSRVPMIVNHHNNYQIWPIKINFSDEKWYLSWLFFSNNDYETSKFLLNQMLKELDFMHPSYLFWKAMVEEQINMLDKIILLQKNFVVDDDNNSSLSKFGIIFRKINLSNETTFNELKVVLNLVKKKYLTTMLVSGENE